MPTAALNSYQGMLQRLGQLASGAVVPVQPVAVPPTAAPAMAPDLVTLTPAAQAAVYAPYPMAGYPAPTTYPGYPGAYPANVQAPQVVLPATVLASNPLGVVWVGASTSANGASAPANTAFGVVWSDPPTLAAVPASSNPLGVEWATAAPAPAPASNTPLGVEWATSSAAVPARAAPDPPPAPSAPAEPSNGSLGSRAVAEAQSYLGVPYVWGGTTPKGFDCSGLMQYVFRSLGISIPRVAADQFRAGREVSRNDLQPGDAVFFKNTGSRTGITHVGMYLGDGKFLHAPKTGDVVKVSNLGDSYYQSHYAGARRYR